ncbi:MAG: DNA-binding protein [Pusillimonas sp.]|nr:DNA-binding protein [Pusillimonas sp.]MBC42311.1 DNA-binding protein [Pusillimonas sp.]HCN70719.1 DNA-binding protein [Pusillimonas sp.]HCP76682.1 DNA-binding protein [Pusillimonas sp.]|tara:strand:+ start:116474 stop:116854 length:381 start_codon:yes stop_codon:yes gene_type:complete
MTRESYASLQQKIEKEIQKLQKQAEALKAKQRTPVIKDIVRKMREYDITPDEIIKTFSKTKETGKRAANGAASGAGNKPRGIVPAKYRNPQTGATWTGRGKAPRWISEAEAQGQSRDTFLINAGKQ